MMRRDKDREPLTGAEIAHLRLAAEAILHEGPWYVSTYHPKAVGESRVFRVYGAAQRGVCKMTHPHELVREAEALYIAAVDPVTVLRLLAELARLKECAGQVPKDKPTSLVDVPVRVDPDMPPDSFRFEQLGESGT